MQISSQLLVRQRQQSTSFPHLFERSPPSPSFAAVGWNEIRKTGTDALETAGLPRPFIYYHFRIMAIPRPCPWPLAGAMRKADLFPNPCAAAAATAAAAAIVLMLLVLLTSLRPLAGAVCKDFFPGAGATVAANRFDCHRYFPHVHCLLVQGPLQKLCAMGGPPQVLVQLRQQFCAPNHHRHLPPWSLNPNPKP